MKEGYKPFIMVHGTAKISVSANGMLFSNAAVRKLNFSKYVNLYINNKEKLFAVEPVSEKGLIGCNFYEPNNRGTVFVRWNHKELLRYLSSLMEWNLNKYRYVVEGNVDYKDGIIEFDLKKAVKHYETEKKIT